MSNQNEVPYEELNFDGLERRGNYRTIAYREDVLHVFDRKDAAAIIYQIVYRWQTEMKRPEILKKIEDRKKAGIKPFTPEEIDDMMFVYMSYNDFVRESGGAIGYNTVIRTIEYLVRTKKVLRQRENHNPKYADFEYSIDKKAMRKFLKELPVDPAFAPKIPKKKSKSTQMGTPATDELDSTQMGTQSTQTGIASTHLGTEVYPNGGTSHNYSHTTHSNHTEEDTYGDVAHANRTPTPSFLSSEENLIPPALSLPQRDNKQARMDEAEQNLIYMDLSANVKSEVVYLTEQKLFEVRFARSTYNGEDMTFFIVKDPHTHEENTYRTETFLKFTEMLRQHSSELKRLTITREVENILAEIDRPEPPTLPTIPNTPPLHEATNSGGVSPIPATTPKHASNSPSVDEPVNHTAESSTMPISGSPPQEMAFPQDEVAESALSTSKRAVSHSQGATGNAALENTPSEDKPEETPEPEKKPTRSRRPSKPKDDEQAKARIDRVFDYFDKLAQEITGVAEYRYGRFEKSRDAIREWLNGNPTEELLREVYSQLWNTPVDKRTGFDWKKNMKIPAVLKEYDSRVLAIMAARRKQAAKVSVQSPSPYIIDDEELDDKFIGAERMHRRHRR